MGRSLGETMDADSFEIAVEHVSWCLRRGWNVNDIFTALGQQPPPNAKWRDAIWAIAKAQDDMTASAVAPAAMRRSEPCISKPLAVPKARPNVIVPIPWPVPGTPLFAF